MANLPKGSLVHHASLGLGKVVAVEATAVHVFFPDSRKRHAAKLRWPLAEGLLRTEGLARDSWLEGLSSFELDPATQRYALAENWLSHDQAVAEFLGRNPAGFGAGEDAAAPGGRAARWAAARACWTERLGGGQGEALLAGDRAELVRRLLELGRIVARIPGVLEEGSLQRALADRDGSPAYLEALLGVVAAAAPSRARMDPLFAAAMALAGAGGAAWPLATLFPFLAHPGRHALLLPKSTRLAAARIGCDLRYDAAPNWTTYAALRGFAGQLLARLAPIGAADFADVEVFLYAIGARRPAADSDPELAPARRRKAPVRARRGAAQSG